MPESARRKIAGKCRKAFRDKLPGFPRNPAKHIEFLGSEILNAGKKLLRESCFRMVWLMLSKELIKPLFRHFGILPVEVSVCFHAGRGSVHAWDYAILVRKGKERHLLHIAN